MNKTIWLSVAAIVVIGLLVFAHYFAATTPMQTVPSQPVSLPAAGTTSTQFTTATTSSGITATNEIQTADFIHDPATVSDPINPGYFYIGYHTPEGIPDPTATSNPPYVITYINATHYFNISLQQEPIGVMRAEAEQYLMAKLGITQTQMCQLNYMVSTPDKVNSQYSGISLGFSFCPGATVLPQ